MAIRGKAEMTCEQFIKGYCERSGITLEQMREFGMVAIACVCGEPDCKGWAMIHVDSPPPPAPGQSASTEIHEGRFFRGVIWQKIRDLFQSTLHR